MTDTLRITFELEMVDNPPLFHDLVQFPKGPRRVNRLRTLAHAGLLAQSAPPGQSGNVAATRLPQPDTAIQAASLELFGPALES